MALHGFLQEGYVEGRINFEKIESIRFNPSSQYRKTELIKVKLLELNSYATVKALISADERHIREFKKEIEFIKRGLKHKNIIRYIGSLTVPSENIFVLMTEYASLGALDELIRTEKDLFDGNRFYSLSTQACKALCFLHDELTIYGTIRSRNVFIENDSADRRGEWTLKLAEFEESKVIQRAYSLTPTLTGNDEIRRWQAPEILEEVQQLEDAPNSDPNAKLETRSTASDAWSLGVLLAEILLAETVPYKSITRQLYLQIPLAISQKRMPFTIPERYPVQLRDSFRRIWDTNPESRLSVHTKHENLVEMREELVVLATASEVNIERAPVLEVGGAVGGAEY